LEINHPSLDCKDKPENIIPKYVVKSESFYDLHGKLKAPANFKTNSSSMKFEIINLGTIENPQNVNLGLSCTTSEQTSFINLLKKYKDIFS